METATTVFEAGAAFMGGVMLSRLALTFVLVALFGGLLFAVALFQSWQEARVRRAERKAFVARVLARRKEGK